MNVKKDNIMKNPATNEDVSAKRPLPDKNRLDLEQEIMHCWNITQDIETLYNEIINRDLSQEDVLNILLGMKVLYDVKFTVMFETFEICIGAGDLDK